jgi:hypothetical protein
MTDLEEDYREAYDLVIAFAEARQRLMMFNDSSSLDAVETLIDEMMTFGERHGIVSDD